jgi:pseudouridine-5'-phosphate glycosidase
MNSINMKNFIEISPEVEKAIAEQKPVVALESTIISHGMPYPTNVETAKLLEQTVRENGAIPATIAIIDGKIKIGLSEKDLDFFGTSKDILKASRRDLPYIIGLKKNAATTVAATMICADLAGIKFFATGGIGGVHRGAENTMDISADLYEFAETDCVVVSAGAKAILDIPLTMEYLETLGVTVLGYGTNEIPAFYYRNSGVSIPGRVDNYQEAAKVVKAKWDMGLKGGLLIGNPVPEEFEMNKAEIEGSIEEALQEAEKNGIIGNKVTPFLLSKLEKITAGKSLETNVALVKNNAKVCAGIAKAYFELLNKK